MGLFRRSTATQDDATEADTIDLTESTSRNGRHVGVPGRCPECDGFGFIDNIDMVHRHQRQHCRDCGYSWGFSFDEDGDAVDEIDLTTAGPSTPADDPWKIDA